MNYKIKKGVIRLRKYYEIWFYYYGEDDERTDFTKEFTFYIKTDKEIKTNDEMIFFLRENFEMTEKHNVDGINCLSEKSLENMTTWFEINGKEFEIGCGIKK